MSGTEETLRRLAAVPSLQVSSCVPLSRHTRFGIGGPADIFAETREVEPFIAAMNIARSSGLDLVVIAGGTNLIVSDAGFRGVALRLIADRLMAAGNLSAIRRSATPRNPASETMRLVPPAMTTRSRPLERAIFIAAMNGSTSRVSAKMSAGPPIPNRVWRER